MAINFGSKFNMKAPKMSATGLVPGMRIRTPSVVLRQKVADVAVKTPKLGGKSSSTKLPSINIKSFTGGANPGMPKPAAMAKSSIVKASVKSAIPKPKKVTSGLKVPTQMF